MEKEIRYNNSNCASKRTANQVKAVLKANSIIFSSVQNLGDGRYFNIYAEGSLQNHIAIKKAGYLIKVRSENYFYIACW